MFEICAAAILTQNTAWNNALAALAGLRGAGKLKPEEISRMSLKVLGRLIRPSGFYRQKAERLKGFAGYILARHPGGLKRWFADARSEALRAELLGLNGIGPETADSMILYAGCKPRFVVDAYTVRLFGRLGLLSGAYAEIQSAFELALPHDHTIYNEYHALIVALGKSNCRKRAPVCHSCPLKSMCAYNKTETRGKNDRYG
jgi:endonuclease-3 related protein